MKTGFIGTGNMGSLLIEAFLESGAIQESECFAFNRTKSKAERLKSRYPDLNITEKSIMTAENCDVLFLCIKPADIYEELKRISPVLKQDTLLVSITSPVSVDQIESVVTCSVARMVPSINNRTLFGNTLITFGTSCSRKDKERLLRLAEKISTPLTTKEEDIRVSSDLCSCGPAFISDLLERMVDAAVIETGIGRKEAEQLITDTVIGMGQLFQKKLFTLESLKEKVCVPGGVTGAGLEAFETGIDEAFSRLFQNTHRKFAEDHRIVDPQFGRSPKRNRS